MHAYLVLVLGIVCAGLGGQVFVRGVVGLARSVRISPGIVGATVAAFATSSPELSVSINSALAGRPQIALGDALGSNVVNVALILGATLAISHLQTPRASVRRDFPIALLAPIAAAVLSWDGELSRFDGMLMLSAFTAWLAAMIMEVRRQRSESAGAQDAEHTLLAVAHGVLGLGLLVAAGYLIVKGASAIALSFGADEFVIGATIVAVGTSVPELATAIVARLRGHDDIGLGTILGSNIFNGFFIVGLAATIYPIAVTWPQLAAALGFGALALVCAYPPVSGLIRRWRGVLLLAVYVLYVATILEAGGA